MHLMLNPNLWSIQLYTNQHIYTAYSHIFCTVLIFCLLCCSGTEFSQQIDSFWCDNVANDLDFRALKPIWTGIFYKNMLILIGLHFSVLSISIIVRMKLFRSFIQLQAISSSWKLPRNNCIDSWKHMIPAKTEIPLKWNGCC